MPASTDRTLRSVSFVVYGVPAPAGSKRAFPRKGGGVIVTDDSKRSKPWQAAVSAAAGEAMRGAPPLAGALYLNLAFTMTRPRGHYGTGRNGETVKPSAPTYPTVKPDATKLARAVEDALTGIVWRDDAQVVLQEIWKSYGPTAGVVITVRELEAAP